jgi:hypothetical protein
VKSPNTTFDARSPRCAKHLISRSLSAINRHELNRIPTVFGIDLDHAPGERRSRKEKRSSKHLRLMPIAEQRSAIGVRAHRSTVTPFQKATCPAMFFAAGSGAG